MKVLVVEDDRPSREFLSKTLQRQGYETMSAEDGLIGLKLFQEFAPDLVFTDIRMPRMDGLELLREIRKRSSDAIVVMTTAFGSEEYTMQALRLRANDYLKKPLKYNELLPLLQKYADVTANRTLEHEILGMIIKRDLTICFDNRFELIGRIVDHLMQETGNAIGRRERLGVHLGLVELLANAIEHGNLEISYQEKTQLMEKNADNLDKLYKERNLNPIFASRRVTVEFHMDTEICRWTITDEGPGFDQSKVPDPTAEENMFANHGRGILLSRMQFDEFAYIGKGNQVRMAKYLNKKTELAQTNGAG
ncbi:MAG: response regulator [Candidatus Riflebacteria bacterium]|nr:response regulator [Candidatus Riflebacteria bacterium]